ncbi:AaceriAER383Wp [[Ashbya] aceris (nom. inval.)]|nr:AaceriAER383Wp [[Ashbya] aceris (nom. inval.)]
MRVTALLLGLCALHVASSKMIANLVTTIDERTGEERKVIPLELKRFFPLDFDDILLRDTVQRNAAMQEDDYKELGKRDMQVAFQTSSVTLDDKLQTLPTISLFGRYIRDIDGMSEALADGGRHIMVFAPTNDAITSMPMKPWEYPRNIEKLEQAGASASEIHDAIQENVKRFVLTHVVSDIDLSKVAQTGSSAELKSDLYPKSMEGGDILLRKDGDRYTVSSSKTGRDFAVEAVHTACNGLVLVINSSLDAEYD